MREVMHHGGMYCRHCTCAHRRLYAPRRVAARDGTGLRPRLRDAPGEFIHVVTVSAHRIADWIRLGSLSAASHTNGYSASSRRCRRSRAARRRRHRAASLTSAAAPRAHRSRTRGSGTASLRRLPRPRPSRVARPSRGRRRSPPPPRPLPPRGGARRPAPPPPTPQPTPQPPTALRGGATGATRLRRAARVARHEGTPHGITFPRARRHRAHCSSCRPRAAPHLRAAPRPRATTRPRTRRRGRAARELRGRGLFRRAARVGLFRWGPSRRRGAATRRSGC